MFFLFFHVVIINADVRKALLYLGQTNNIYRCASLHVYLEGFDIMGVGSGWREISGPTARSEVILRFLLPFV